MTDQDGAQELDTIDGKPTKKRRFDARDWDTIAEFVTDEHRKRRDSSRRSDLEKQWKEIDRQIRMEPDIGFKKLRSGADDPSRLWMPEVELPLQAETLEVLTADALRMQFPDSGPWFASHADMTDEYLARVDFQSLVSGDENEVPSKITQDNADQLVAGWLTHYHRQYDFTGHLDHINAEAFKYGTGIGRGRTVRRQVFMSTASGVEKKREKIPVLFPRTIKKTYPDDKSFNLLNEGYILGPAMIYAESKRLEDMQIAANSGSNDPDDPDGGWMPVNIKGLQGDENGDVEVLEFEGDLVVPRKTTKAIVIHGAIVTVLNGKDTGKATGRVVRFRYRKSAYPSYLLFPYHSEELASPYAAGPLMKGLPLQKGATEMFNRLLQAGILNTEPPIRYDRDDPWFAQQGGPVIQPRALWATLGAIEVMQIGDPVGLTQAYLAMLAQYSDVTGVSAPRLGAQTVSHTTAYAKEVELGRGQVRTVDYVRATLRGPLTQWLYMEFEMGLESMGKGLLPLYLDGYNGWVEISREHLPDRCVFEAFGAGGPSEAQAKRQMRLSALQFAVQIDALKVQNQLGEPMDYDAIQRQVLLDGGWTDVDAFLRSGGAAAGAGAAPGMAGPGGAAALAGPQAAILQSLAAAA